MKEVDMSDLFELDPAKKTVRTKGKKHSSGPWKTRENDLKLQVEFDNLKKEIERKASEENFHAGKLTELGTRDSSKK